MVHSNIDHTVFSVVVKNGASTETMVLGDLPGRSNQPIEHFAAFVATVADVTGLERRPRDGC
jgi:hypothetical protein